MGAAFKSPMAVHLGEGAKAMASPRWGWGGGEGGRGGRVPLDSSGLVAKVHQVLWWERDSQGGCHSRWEREEGCATLCGATLHMT